MAFNFTRSLKRFLCSPCGMLNFVYILATSSVLLLIHLMYVNNNLKSFVPILKTVNKDVKRALYFQTFNLATEAPTHSPSIIKTDRVSVENRTLVSKRPDVCDSCFPHHYTYILDNEDICSVGDDKKDVKIIVLISTTHVNTARRKALRETWLTHTRSNTGDVRYAFLLGATANNAEQVALETESATYGDIIQEDFIDSYNNLTLKTIMAFKWASLKCKVAKFFMKTDDDMFVNLKSLMDTVKKYSFVLEKGIGGYCNLSREPIRSNTDKWSVTYEMYPHKLYPPYCSGTGYVTNLNVVEKVYQVSKDVPFIYLEDVYVSLCLERLRLNVTHLPGFHPGLQKIGCEYKTKNLVTSHRLTPKMLHEVWNLKNCSENT